MRIGHAVAGITVVAGGLLLTGCAGFGQNTFDDREVIGQTITEVRFANDSGDVKIEIGDTTELRRKVSHGDEKPGTSHEVDGGALVLAPCPERDCRIDYELTVPAGTKVSGHVDSGRVEVVGVAAANVAAESGDISVRDVAGEVNVSVQSGTVDLDGIGGAVVASAESGDVTVGLAEARKVSVETQSGNIEVVVPSGKYHISASTENGNLDTIDDDPSGLPVEAHAQSGDVTVRNA